MWAVGFVNVAALMPQPIAIIQTHQVSGISISMFVLFAFVQAVFAIEFFLKRSWGAMTSMIASLTLSLVTIGLVLWFQ